MKKMLCLVMLFIGAVNTTSGMQGVKKRSKNLTQELFDAIDDCNIGSVSQLLQEGASLEVTDNYGNTPLHAGVKSGDAEVVDFLINNGASIEATDGASRTPLHLAVSQESLDILETLLRNNANVDALDNQGETPLHALCGLCGQPEAAKLLIRYNANIRALSKSGITPLGLAVLSLGSSLVRCLQIPMESLSQNPTNEIPDQLRQDVLD